MMETYTNNTVIAAADEYIIKRLSEINLLRSVSAIVVELKRNESVSIGLALLCLNYRES